MFTGGVDALAQPPSSCKVQAGDNPSEAAVIAVAGRSGSVFRRARNRRQARLQYGLPRVQKFSSPLQHAVACFLFRPRRSARQKSCAGASRLSASVTRGPRTTMSSPCWPAWGASASASLRRPSENTFVVSRGGRTSSDAGCTAVSVPRIPVRYELTRPAQDATVSKPEPPSRHLRQIEKPRGPGMRKTLILQTALVRVSQSFQGPCIKTHQRIQQAGHVRDANVSLPGKK